MKIYSQDNHWRGCVVVLARDMEHAIELMSGCLALDPYTEIVEHDINEPKVIVDNIGDM